MPPVDNNGNSAPATKQDLSELRNELKSELKELIVALAQRIDGVELRLAARIERAETTLLTGFHSQMRGIETRMARMRADISNVDSEMQGRLEVLEQRIAAIEQRLPLS